MSDFDEIKGLITSHIKDSNEFREEMKTSMAKIKVHAEYTQKAVEGNVKDISNIKTVQDKQKGGMIVIGLMGVGGIIKAIFDFFRHT